MIQKPSTSYLYLRHYEDDHGSYAFNPRRHYHQDYEFCPYCSRPLTPFHDIDRCRDRMNTNRIISSIIGVGLAILFMQYLAYLQHGRF